MMWNEYYAVCTMDDIVIVVEEEGHITKRFEWHKLNEDEFTYTVIKKGKTIKNTTHKFTEAIRKRWAARVCNQIVT